MSEAVNGHAVEVEELDPSEWLSSADAQAFLGCGSQKLSKLAIAQRIERKQSAGGFAYSLASMRAYAEETADETPGGEKLTTTTPELVLMLRAAQSHAAESFKMVHSPAAKLIEHYEKLLERAGNRIAHLESAHDEAVRARETALTEEHTRKLNEELAHRRAARWDAAFEVLKQTAPAILSQVIETVAEAGDPSKKAAFRLMQRFTPERLAELLKTDAVDADERTLIAEILREQADRAKAKREAEEQAQAAQAAPASSPAPAPKAKAPRKRGGKARTHGNG